MARTDECLKILNLFKNAKLVFKCEWLLVVEGRFMKTHFAVKFSAPFNL
jgi:hypothetical protein